MKDIIYFQLFFFETGFRKTQSKMEEEFSSVYDYNAGLNAAYNRIPPILFSSENPDAIFPKKIDETDATFPLAIVKRLKNRLEDQFQGRNEFSTDVKLTVPPGFYVDIEGSEELNKHGYFLLSNKKVNPRNCNETVDVFLFKFEDKDDLQLPFPQGLIGTLKRSNYARINRKIGNVLTKETSHSFEKSRQSARIDFGKTNSFF